MVRDRFCIHPAVLSKLQLSFVDVAPLIANRTQIGEIELFVRVEFDQRNHLGPKPRHHTLHGVEKQASLPLLEEAAIVQSRRVEEQVLQRKASQQRS